MTELVKKLDGRVRLFMREHAEKNLFWENSLQGGLPKQVDLVIYRLLQLDIIECREVVNLPTGYGYMWTYLAAPLPTTFVGRFHFQTRQQHAWLVLEKASLGCLNVWLLKDGHSNGVPAMSQQFTESDRAVLAQLLALQVPKQEIAARLKKHRSSIVSRVGPQQRAPRLHPDRSAAAGRGAPPAAAAGRQAERSAGPGVCRAGAWSSVGRPIRLPAARGESSRVTTGSSSRGRRSTTGSPTSVPSSAKHWRQLLAVWPTAAQTAGKWPFARRRVHRGPPARGGSRRRFGDWEGDTIVGRGHRGGLVSLVERKSGYTLLARVEDRVRRPCGARLSSD